MSTLYNIFTGQVPPPPLPMSAGAHGWSIIALAIYYDNFYASTNNRRQRHYVFWSSVRLSVNTYLTWRYISVLSGRISMKLDTHIHHVSENCWKGFQGQRSKVKVMSS